jgi:DNA-binding PadR family transcriptional regulator
MATRPDPESKLPLSNLVYLVLLVLADGPLHGYGIIKEVDERTGGATTLEAGTLYAALKRLKEDDIIAVAHTGVHQGRHRRDYALTEYGRKILELESQRLADLVRMARARRVLPADSN